MRIRYLHLLEIIHIVLALLLVGCNSSNFLTLKSEIVYSATDNNTIRSIGWTHNSDSLAFTTLKPTTGEVKIYLLDLATQDFHILSDDYFIFEAWSADGENIVARSTQSNDLWIIPLNAPDQPEVLGPGQDASWAPDNNYLALANRKILRVKHLEEGT